MPSGVYIRTKDMHPGCKSHTQEWKDNNSRKLKGTKHSKESVMRMVALRKLRDNYRWKSTIKRKRKCRYSSRRHDPEWHRIRKEVYIRDRWSCRVCGKHCHGNDIQCHHIVPYRITQDNSINNLITLCNKCHLKEEWLYYKKIGGRGLLWSNNPKGEQKHDSH